MSGGGNAMDDAGDSSSDDGGNSDGSGNDRVGLAKADDIQDPDRTYLDEFHYFGRNLNLGYSSVPPFH
jgi:hypothetical protein